MESDPGEGGDGAPGVAALRVPPPEAEAVAIEFPGFIRNPARALAALGGEPEAAAALDARAAVLKLWLRPDDPLSHPLFGERRRTRSLLLRIARRRPGAGSPGASGNGGGSNSGDGSSSGGGDSGASVAVVAAVPALYRFTGLADFQYLPVDPKAPARAFGALPERNRPEAAEVFRRPQPFLLVPPLFLRSDVPLDFPFADDAPEGERGRGRALAPQRWERVLGPPVRRAQLACCACYDPARPRLL
jgi:general transcription factor 3C polypeptide 5 (transcription factor C subunit 1)